MGDNPWIAALLGWIPGFGHIYVGEFKKGIGLHALGLGLFISGIGLFLQPILIIYSVVDAYKSAKSINS